MTSPVFNRNIPISTHFILDFFLPSEIVTIWQTDCTAHKLKPRSFYKSIYFWVHIADFHPQYELHLTKRISKNKRKIYCYSSLVVHQIVLPGMNTLFTEVISLNLDYSISTVSLQLLFFSFLKGLLSYLIFWRGASDFLSFGFCNLESLSAFQKSSFLGQNFILELLQVLYSFTLVLFLYKSLFLSFLLCLGLSDFLCFLHSLLNTVSFSCLFQAGLELLLLFMLLLHFLVLLFKHFYISLGNVRKWGRRYDNIRKSWKFSSCLCIVDLGTIIDSLDKLNRTSKTHS